MQADSGAGKSPSPGQHSGPPGRAPHFAAASMVTPLIRRGLLTLCTPPLGLPLPTVARAATDVYGRRDSPGSPVMSITRGVRLLCRMVALEAHALADRGARVEDGRIRSRSP